MAKKTNEEKYIHLELEMIKLKSRVDTLANKLNLIIDTLNIKLDPKGKYIDYKIK